MNEQWFLLGDIHGSAQPIYYFYQENKERLNLDSSENYMILLGDVGANFALTGQRDHKFKSELSKLPFTFICLRGNHEARVKTVMDKNPDGWETISKYDGSIFVEKEFPHIEYLADGPEVYNFKSYKTLSLPGAYSVDKYYRLARHLTWYEDEQLDEKEMELGRKLCRNEAPFDLVLSHTCPYPYEPTDLFLAGLDQSTVDSTMERYLGEIEFNLDYKRWAFGHFHADRLYPWAEGRQMLMLFNENVVSLDKFMHMTEKQSFKDIIA